jgi:beta-lactamase regulating signal transducer with metallopeptidase domain
MEAVLLYVFKVCLLLTAYFVTYYFLLQKETFYNGNRWFLLTGLITSALLPLAFVTQTVWIEPQPNLYLHTNLENHVSTTVIPNPASPGMDWTTIGLYVYSAIVILLVLQLIWNIQSIFRKFKTNDAQVINDIRIIDSPENEAPFSFFNVIVINSSLYTKDELESIIHHEMVHSKEKHTFDVLLAHLYCIVFWFHPIVWLYKKAIQHNLEFIADRKAIATTNSPISYQKALLKVIAHHNKISITNHFNQSLIKKRIVMLNTNQSKKRNFAKYFFIIPALLIFFLTFQIKTIAQVKPKSSTISTTSSIDAIKMKITSNTSDKEIKEDEAHFKSLMNVDVKTSKIKRNKDGAITTIKVDIKTATQKKTIQYSGSDPIVPFAIIVTKDDNGKLTIQEESDTRSKSVSAKKMAITKSSKIEKENLDDYDVDYSISFSDTHTDKDNKLTKGKKFKISKEGNNKTSIIVDGKKVFEGEFPEVMEEFKKSINEDLSNNKGSINYSFDFSSSAMDELTDQLSKSKELAKKTIELARKELKNAQPENNKIIIDLNESVNDLENAKKDLERAHIELKNTREEIIKARQEFSEKNKSSKKE